MTTDLLSPSLDLITEEYVLVQAWKKTASYIRSHNWYSDTLELDRTAVNLPSFISDLARRLGDYQNWKNDPLRIVPAPKSQRWHISPDNKRWGPVDAGKTASKLRPLAHVSLKDQVAATALLLCLANRVETAQGDPREESESPEARQRVISYGNRLYCDEHDGVLRHRWGAVTLYRAYYQDYQSFLARPEVAAKAIEENPTRRVVIVHSDLRQFFDRVRPLVLLNKLLALRQPSDDPRFYTLAGRVLNWTWHQWDAKEVRGYAAQAGLSEFSEVALPQGLVAAGFFANVFLLDFDAALRAALHSEIRPGVHLEDSARYVDDLRLVVLVDGTTKLVDLEALVTHWLQELLDRTAEGLSVSREKTKAAAVHGAERPLVRQSRKMARIQHAVSGGFDTVGGEDILDAVQGLIRSQQRYSESRTTEDGWSFSPIPDVRDTTVSRFAATRFRSTYRSLRPLLADRDYVPRAAEDDGNEETPSSLRSTRTQADLDNEAKAFALGLIEQWIEDPSNVRLLRIGLDLWPSKDVLTNVLGHLRAITETRRKAPRRVAWYCLAEIFRAGATETGLVEDEEALPLGVNLAEYRQTLQAEAVRVASLPAQSLPWYLRQQVFLYLAASDSSQAPVLRSGRNPETRHYRELIRFLNGEGEKLKGADFATLAVLARRSFRNKQRALQLANAGLTSRRVEQIAERDPSFALELVQSLQEQTSQQELTDFVSPRLRDDLCLDRAAGDGGTTLANVVLGGGPRGILRDEAALLQFAVRFLDALTPAHVESVVTPTDVVLLRDNVNRQRSVLAEVRITPSRVAPTGSIYLPPSWCPAEQRWRFQLGYLLRFILAARPDYTRAVRLPSWKEEAASYRAPESHWYQRLYGLFNGQSAFGDDWLPISEWTEQLLMALLHWPGCRAVPMQASVDGGIVAARKAIADRSAVLEELQGSARSALMLPLISRAPTRTATTRPLRVCVVQTAIPAPEDVKSSDLTLSDMAFRRNHRRHLSAALAAVERMLDLRETHKGREGRLDLLVFPELAVHPRDVGTHLIPFARAHKTIILTGLTYQAVIAGEPLVNSALWVIPEWSAAHGLQVTVRRQGKHHLAPEEEVFNSGGAVIQGFRPCQWLIGYEWTQDPTASPLWLTAAICYDATDLALAADLRSRSDVMAIPAMNRDVTTFDQMAQALHYHMFQLVLVANSGVFGGSNAYAPYDKPYTRQVFHMHGQPQASIAFLEIDDIAEFLKRRVRVSPAAAPGASGPKTTGWKSPPAGL